MSDGIFGKSANKIRRNQIKKRKKGKDYYLIKWKGYKDTTYEPYDILIIDIPKMIIKYDREHDITH